MSFKQARLIVNAHKHNLLINSFCNNGYVYIKQHENNNKNQERDRERMLLRAASNHGKTAGLGNEVFHAAPKLSSAW